MQDNTQNKDGSSEIRTIKDDAMTLAQDIKEHGGDAIRDGANQLRSTVDHEFHKVEEYVKEKPAQSILLAFGAGLIASYILGSRR